MSDYLFRGDLAEIDPEVAELIRHETARQERCLILIPSESTIPAAVREALGSAFHNIYAEGYPLDETRTMTQVQILDYDSRLPEYRRDADKRYYKGTEYANIIEALARRRAAELFATARYAAEKLFVNVQPLSGAPANNAIFSALLNVGDTIMGLDLRHGGHLTHGSPVNRSGKQYKVVSYEVDPVTERLDYDAIRALALEHRPRIIIAGYTSYPFAPDWARFREIADESGAILMADIAHVAGLVIAGAYPSPVGIADVVSFTTHKTLAGPRGAVIITHRADLSTKIDRAVFPGEQGGPHVNAIAALAVALRLAYTDQFRQLQRQTVANAARLADQLSAHGIRIGNGGTNTHLLVIDCKSIVGADGTSLSGTQAVRILDLAGIVANFNTLPGDPSALRASGVRLGTPWVTQRGFGDAEIDTLAGIIADLLKSAVPFSYTGKKRAEPRARVPFEALMTAKNAVRDLAATIGIDTDAGKEDYPHFYYLNGQHADGWHTLSICAVNDTNVTRFLDTALTADVSGLAVGASAGTRVLEADGRVMARGVIEKMADGYRLHVENAARVAMWLRALSDGFVLLDSADPYAKAPGPVDVRIVGAAPLGIEARAVETVITLKAYHIGGRTANGAALPAFTWTEPEAGALKITPLHTFHRETGAKLAPFAGYDMPLWYSSVTEEHAAVRKSAGVFDVTHMGVFMASGAGAADFLQAAATNDIDTLKVGESHYTYLLDVDGVPHDDLMIYRVAQDDYLLVVNASNNDKNWAWLNALKNGSVMIDAAQPARTIGRGDRFTLRDLRDPAAGEDQRVDVALQGPQSKTILLSLGLAEADSTAISALPWAGVHQATIGGFDLIVSRTGYTGERTAYELFVHPDRADALFRTLITAGATACGLAARDSLRTEAGLPLYGHELAGELRLNPADAGFGSYVKLWKPFFVGRAAFLQHERERDAEIARFRLAHRGVRPPHAGDPVVDDRGRVIGFVTSCSIDIDGYQLGQAYIKSSATDVDTPIAVVPNGGQGALRAPTMGAKLNVPEPAIVLSRFPTSKKS